MLWAKSISGCASRARLTADLELQVLLISYSDDFGAMWSSPHKLDIHKGGTPGASAEARRKVLLCQLGP